MGRTFAFYCFTVFFMLWSIFAFTRPNYGNPAYDADLSRDHFNNCKKLVRIQCFDKYAGSSDNPGRLRFIKMERINYAPAGTGELQGEIRVRDMVNYFRTINVLHPAVSFLCGSPEDQEILQQSLAHEWEIIRRRSHRLADNEISIVQKAFMILMDDMEARAGATELYVEEILGIKLVRDVDQLKTFQTALKARNMVFHKSSSDGQLQLPPIQTQTVSRGFNQAKQHQIPGALRINTLGSTRIIEKEESLFLSSRRLTPPIPTSASKSDEEFFMLGNSNALRRNDFNPDTDPKFLRLWSLFEKAQTEYNVLNDSLKATTAARFLRDTIENVISYIESNRTLTVDSKETSHNDPNGLREKIFHLEVVLKQAMAAAERGCGGKKRRFDFARSLTDVPTDSKALKSERSSEIIIGEMTTPADTFGPSDFHQRVNIQRQRGRVPIREERSRSPHREGFFPPRHPRNWKEKWPVDSYRPTY